MTSPTNTRDDLSALLDGELSDAELAALEQELEADDALRGELDGIRDVAEGLRSLPDVKAPDGFLAAVMGRIDAGEGLDEPLDDSGADVVPLVPAVAPVDEPLPDNVVRFPWWIKGPVLTAIAALLVVGVGIGMRDRGPMGPPAASEVVAFSPSEPVAPRPTGVVAAEDAELAGDAVADAGEPAEDSGDAAERIRMTPADSERVAVGGAGTSPAVPAAPRRSGIREVEAPAPPPGVVAIAEAEYSPEPEADVDGDGVAMDEGSSADSLVPEMSAGALSAVESSPSARAKSAADRGAMTAVASLRTGDGGAVTALRDIAARRGWAINYVTPGDAAVQLSDLQPEAVVELQLPPGDEVAAQAALDDLGAFSFSSTPERSDGASSRLRITIIYAP
ncbi:MAG: hypothetical protein KDA24_16740 [Deltaproteobacteria bacterium]|nr:hypothetical protein [Deltaproteobacteria bacterium]